MTQESAKANLEFITAFANGETIQCLAFGKYWQDLDEPSFVADAEDRIKPKGVSALCNEKTKRIQYLCDNESDIIKFNLPYGVIIDELVKFNE